MHEVIFSQVPYSFTLQVYEGEWVDDAPKCGEYREPTREEELRFQEPTIARETFNLPKLGLLDPQSIIDMAKSESRISNAGRRGLEAPVATSISKERMCSAALVFGELSRADNGLVILSNLSPVFAELGSDFSQDNIDAIKRELEIDNDTGLSFPEVTDIALYLLSNAESVYEYEK